MKLLKTYEILDSSINIPKIKLRKRVFGSHESQIAVIGWRGENSTILPENIQFFFEPAVQIDSPEWHDDPYKFRVVYIGPVRNFPREEAEHTVGKVVDWGILDQNVAWMISSYFPQDHPIKNRKVVASIMTRVGFLNDVHYEIVRPIPYIDLDVLEEESINVRKQVLLAKALIKNPKMELPKERTPWVDKPNSCKLCKNLEDSAEGDLATPIDGNGRDNLYVCSCGRRWWQNNSYFHLWQYEKLQPKWDRHRRREILLRGGYKVERSL